VLQSKPIDLAAKFFNSPIHIGAVEMIVT